jgi:hypothetical protein
LARIWRSGCTEGAGAGSGCNRAGALSPSRLAGTPVPLRHSSRLHGLLSVRSRARCRSWSCWCLQRGGRWRIQLAHGDWSMAERGLCPMASNTLACRRVTAVTGKERGRVTGVTPLLPHCHSDLRRSTVLE